MMTMQEYSKRRPNFRNQNGCTAAVYSSRGSYRLVCRLGADVVSKLGWQQGDRVRVYIRKTKHTTSLVAYRGTEGSSIALCRPSLSKDLLFFTLYGSITDTIKQQHASGMNCKYKFTSDQGEVGLLIYLPKELLK